MAERMDLALLKELSREYPGQQFTIQSRTLYLGTQAAGNGYDVSHLFAPNFLKNQLPSEVAKIKQHFGDVPRPAAPNQAGATVQNPAPQPTHVQPAAGHPQGPVPPAQPPQVNQLRQQEDPAARKQRLAELRAKAAQKRAAHQIGSADQHASTLSEEERQQILTQQQGMTAEQLAEWEAVENSMSQDTLTKMLSIAMEIVDQHTPVGAQDRALIETAFRKLFHASLLEVASAVEGGPSQSVDQLEAAREMKDLRDNLEQTAARCTQLERERTQLQVQVHELQTELEEVLTSFVNAPTPAPSPVDVVEHPGEPVEEETAEEPSA